MQENLYEMFKPNVHLMNRLNKNDGKTCIEKKSNKGKVANWGENKDEIRRTQDKKEKEKKKRKENYADDDELEYSSGSDEEYVYGNGDNISVGSKKEENTCDWEKYEMDEYVTTAVKIAAQYILNVQPFPVKRNDLFNLINYHLPNRFRNYKKRDAVIYLARTYFRENLGLNLLEMEHKKNKEYVLSQLVLYDPHNNVLFSQWEHRIRGLLIFLMLLFRMYENKIPLGYLLKTLENCGWKSKKTKKETVMFLCSQKYNNRDNLLGILKRKNVDIEYLLAYIKLLKYIDFFTPQPDKGHRLNDYYCVASSRYEQETCCDSLIEKLMQIPNKGYYYSDISYVFNLF